MLWHSRKEQSSAVAFHLKVDSGNKATMTKLRDTAKQSRLDESTVKDTQHGVKKQLNLVHENRHFAASTAQGLTAHGMANANKTLNVSISTLHEGQIEDTDLERSSLVMVGAEHSMMMPRFVIGLPAAMTVRSLGSRDRAAMDMSPISVWFVMLMCVMSL